MAARLRRFVLASLLLTACASTTITPAAPPTVVVTSTPLPAATRRPTVTASPTPTATATPTPTLTPTPTPPLLNPLTGLVVADPRTLDRRPLAIKVAHFPRRVRQDQVGLSFADHVWEHYAEGGVTRFTAIFLGQGAERVGNVRSARLLDAILGEAYQALLVASGSSTGTMNRLRENPALFERVIAEARGYSGCPLLCREESAALTTDRLYTSTSALWGLADELGLNGRQNLDGLVFDPQPPAGGAEATTIHIDFQLNNTVAEWRYDAATQTYARWIDTAELPALAPHVDTANGQLLTAANVAVLYVEHVPSNIREDDNARYFSYDILLTGDGPARLFRDGRMYAAVWTRAEAGLPRFVDAAGEAVPFKPGVTWFEVLSPDSPTRVGGGLFYARFKAPNPFPDTPTPTP